MEERELPCPGPSDLFVCLGGSSFSLQGPERDTVLVAPGDIVVIKSALAAANDQRRAWARSAQRLELWCATVARAAVAASGAPPAAETLTLRAAQIALEPRLSGALALLRLELAEPGGSPVALAQLSALVMRYALGPRAEQSPPSHMNAAVRRALELLHGEPARRWTLPRLSRACGASRAALARHFAKAVGSPPLRYLTELRLRRAAELLVESDLSLAEVADEVGYDSEFAFNRAFKRQHGLPPGTFRRQRRTSAPFRVELRRAA